MKLTSYITTACLLASSLFFAAGKAGAQQASAEYQDFNNGGTGDDGNWTPVIVVKQPQLRSEIQGSTKVEFLAPGMDTAGAFCWQQPGKQNPDPAGHDVAVASNLHLDAEGNGSFVFPADEFPNGPITLRIIAKNGAGKRDIREVQLFNKGGVVWNQGIPKSDPFAAKGMKLVFADDFDTPPSISKDGQGARYCSHKPGGGDFSGWKFSDFEGPQNPFSQAGTFLRIHASKQAGMAKGVSGLISPVKMDGTGPTVSAPCYMECRFLAQSAPGTWPAFWAITTSSLKHKIPSDELDIIEAYGGVGKGNPNHPGYSITSHFWNQKGPDGKALPNINKRVRMSEVGDKSYWSTRFHTYAVKVGKDDTIYYLDDIEVLRHPTGHLSATEPMFFMINYAIGGISGWKIDLERDGNATDMYVDYVRVYQGGSNP